MPAAATPDARTVQDRYAVYSGKTPPPRVSHTQASGAGKAMSQPLDLVMPEVIARYLRTSFVGRTMLYTSTTGSTNDDAKALAADYPEGTVFVAESQSGGKGRIGRRWSSPPGGVSMSVLLRPKIPPSGAPALSLVAGYAVAMAIRDRLDLDARMKWPNDVLVGVRKVCGVLCEMRAEAGRVAEVIAGIGINANTGPDELPPEVRDSAASLKVLAGRTVNRNRLIADVLGHLEIAYRDFLSRGLEGLVPKIMAVCAFLGEPVSVRNLTAADHGEVLGVFQGIDVEGRALLKLPGGETRTLAAGDLSLRVHP